MKKIILTTFFLSIFFGFSNTGFADSGTSSIGYNNNIVECPTSTSHGLTHYGVPNSNNSSAPTSGTLNCTTHTYYTSGDYLKNIVVGITACAPGERAIFENSTQIRCRKFDDINPDIPTMSFKTGTIDYIPGSTVWVNSEVTATLNCIDTGGSGCDTTNDQYRTNSTPFTCDSGGTWVDYTGPFPIDTALNTNRTLYVCGRVKDVAGNGYIYSTVYRINIDRTIPNTGDISGNGVTKNGSYIIAKTSEDFSISVDNAGGSPITNIQGRFEQHNNPSGWNTYTSTNSNLVFNSNISNVDLQRTNGYRTYTFEVTSITDEAGNTSTTNPVATYNYYVYAGNIDSGKSLLDGTIYNLNNIANGNPYTLSGSLRDSWDNMIVPVIGVRDVNLNINYSNQLYLNQYSNILPRPTSVYAYNGAIDLSLSSGINFTKLLQNDPDGTYNIDFKVYSPTEIAYNKAKGYFTINNIKASVSDIGTDITLNNSNIPFSFKPIYQTTINSPVTTDGFMIQATQTGTIDIIRNGTIYPTATLSLEFGSGGTSSSSPLYSPKFNMKLTSPGILDISGTNDYEGYSKRRDYKSFNSDQTYSLNTLLTQSGVVDNTAGQYLSSHIGYTIAGPSGNLNVLYNGDILGKTNYWASPSGIPTNTNQGLKIGGIVSSQNQTDITTDQGANDLHIVGNISKTILKKDMRENVYNLINQVTPNNGGNKITDLNGDGAKTEIWYNSDGKKTLSDKVLYFNGEDVTLESGDTLTGKKTIIVVGGNLYIKSNVVNDPIGSNILGIIVLKDDNGDGGNLYIDPDVTRIDAVIYTDKSLISYDETRTPSELDGNTPQAVLKNQLYINGSVFSENTIGGSIKNPLVCPYYVLSTDCDSQKKAQKYDLNFLRRYYVGASGPINSGLSVLNPTDPNYIYPVVIKYNPQIQSDPPPLFGN